MTDFEKLAEQATSQLQNEQGFISASPEGEPPVGQRYHFDSEIHADQYMSMRQIQGISNQMHVEDNDLVEIWK